VWLVLPRDAVEVQELGELTLRVVREPDIGGPVGTVVDRVDLAVTPLGQV
jgi:hypothetical protein